MASIGQGEWQTCSGRRGRMLQSLYEAARKEVFADPAAAVRKYQPNWQFSCRPRPASHPATAEHRAPHCCKSSSSASRPSARID